MRIQLRIVARAPLALLVFLSLAPVVSSAGAQTSTTDTKMYGCYAANSGEVYLIKQHGLPDECRKRDVQFSWNEPGDVGPSGPSGDAGPIGITGKLGIAGIQGPAGAKGERGTSGEPGARGTPGQAGAKGDVGPQGPAGAKGFPGKTVPIPGPQGPTGATGPQGATGPRGVANTKKGPKGFSGLAGVAGPAGPRADDMGYLVDFGTESFTVPARTVVPGTDFTLSYGTAERRVGCGPWDIVLSGTWESVGKTDAYWVTSSRPDVDPKYVEGKPGIYNDGWIVRVVNASDAVITMKVHTVCLRQVNST